MLNNLPAVGVRWSGGLTSANQCTNITNMSTGSNNELTNPTQFFLNPRSPRQRQYEALRAYFVQGLPSAEVAHAFGYSPGTFRVLCSHFRHDPQAREFFPATAAGRPPGVRHHDPVRGEAIALRKRDGAG